MTSVVKWATTVWASLAKMSAVVCKMKHELDWCFLNGRGATTKLVMHSATLNAGNPVNLKREFLSSDELYRWLQWVPLKKGWETEASCFCHLLSSSSGLNIILQIFLATTRKLWGSYTFKLWELLLSNEYVLFSIDQLFGMGCHF